MTAQRIAAAGFWVAISSVVVFAQQGPAPSEPPPQPPSVSVLEHTDVRGGVLPWRRVQERSVSSNRDLLVETIEEPNVDGRMAPSRQIVTETVRSGPNTTNTRRDLYRVDSERQGRLMVTMESEQKDVGNASRTVRNVWTSDVNDHLRLATRQIDVTNAVTPTEVRGDSTLLVPGINEPLEAREHAEYTERRIGPATLQHEQVYQVRGANGEWLPIEARTGETRDVGPSGRREEETIQRVGVNGKLVPVEKSVTRRSAGNGREEVVVETHRPNAEGVLRTDSLSLSQRTRRTTTMRSDGGRYTVEEVEARNPVALSDPLRLVRRTVETVRPTGEDRWTVDRQVFERDINGRLVLTTVENEETAGE